MIKSRPCISIITTDLEVRANKKSANKKSATTRSTKFQDLRLFLHRNTNNRRDQTAQISFSSTLLFRGLQNTTEGDPNTKDQLKTLHPNPNRNYRLVSTNNQHQQQ